MQHAVQGSSGERWTPYWLAFGPRSSSNAHGQGRFLTLPLVSTRLHHSAQRRHGLSPRGAAEAACVCGPDAEAPTAASTGRRTCEEHVLQSCQPRPGVTERALHVPLCKIHRYLNRFFLLRGDLNAAQPVASWLLPAAHHLIAVLYCINQPAKPLQPTLLLRGFGSRLYLHFSPQRAVIKPFGNSIAVFSEVVAGRDEPRMHR